MSDARSAAKLLQYAIAFYGKVALWDASTATPDWFPRVVSSQCVLLSALLYDANATSPRLRHWLDAASRGLFRCIGRCEASLVAYTDAILALPSGSAAVAGATLLGRYYLSPSVGTPPVTGPLRSRRKCACSRIPFPWFSSLTCGERCIPPGCMSVYDGGSCQALPCPRW